MYQGERVNMDAPCSPHDGARKYRPKPQATPDSQGGTECGFYRPVSYYVVYVNGIL